MDLKIVRPIQVLYCPVCDKILHSNTVTWDPLVFQLCILCEIKMNKNETGYMISFI